MGMQLTLVNAPMGMHLTLVIIKEKRNWTNSHQVHTIQVMVITNPHYQPYNLPPPHGAHHQHHSGKRD